MLGSTMQYMPTRNILEAEHLAIRDKMLVPNGLHYILVLLYVNFLGVVCQLILVFVISD